VSKEDYIERGRMLAKQWGSAITDEAALYDIGYGNLHPDHISTAALSLRAQIEAEAARKAGPAIEF